MKIDIKEVRRYLGMSKSDALDSEIEACAKRLEAAASLRSTHTCGEIIRRDASIEICGIKMTGDAIAKHLQNCREAYLFAATLGIEADRLIYRLSLTDMSASLITDACATALLEQFADDECSELGDNLTSRFSAGYGDLPLELQPQFVAALNAPKRIGVTVTDGLMLAPTKSITAVLGILNDNACQKTGCAACENKNCDYRRENT